MTGNVTVTSGAKDTGPLDWRIAIVDKTGRPTQEFQRKWATQRANNALIGSVTFGTGVPTGSPADGAEYVDTTKEPWVLYIGENSQWNIVGVQDFINLDDVPGNYTSSGDHLVRVNGNATGLEFVTVSTGLDGIGNATGDILVRGNSTWTVIPPGNATTVLTSNGTTSTPSWQASSGGGGGGTLPAIRGSGIQASSATTYTVNWPTGTIAGDVALIFVGGGFGIASTPTGWTLLDNQQGSNWNGAVLGKVLASGDISTGHVVITNAGSFDSVVAIITFHGSTSGIFGLLSQRNGSGSSVISLSGAAFSAGAMGVYFGSNRAASTNTVSQGTNLQQANDGSAASGCLYAGAPTAPFVSTAAFNYSSAGSGNYQVQILVAGP